ncbi:MAG: hypothetical protein J6K58_03460 [Lachnospiraceae bacterium]|nr:hypothetical protein [Lachnospiraceae bacterium]
MPGIRKELPVAGPAGMSNEPDNRQTGLRMLQSLKEEKRRNKNDSI